MATLYFDCFSGASGDMILGALIDAGVPLDLVREALGSLAIDGGAVWTERVLRAGVSATKFCVRGEDAAPDHTHPHAHPHHHHHHEPHVHLHGHSHEHGHDHPDHHHHDHPHRSLAEIGALIDTSGLSQGARTRAKALFHRLGEAEAAIHGTSLDEVHLHEVGALDSIIDIVGAVFALEHLGVQRIVSSPLNIGSGSIRSAHGTYPVPAPATLRLLQDVPVYAGLPAHELLTPTGALLISDYASAYGSQPPMRIRRVGYGAGSRDVPDRPNVLRVIVGDEDESAALHAVVVIEAEIDDMNPQIFGALMDVLFADGALDVYYTPIQMKKNRPGTLLTVVGRPVDRSALTARIFAETTTIGVRYLEMQRECLERESIPVSTPYGEVLVKVARRDGAVRNAAPEFDACLRLARESGTPVKDVHAAAMKAFLDLPRP